MRVTLIGLLIAASFACAPQEPEKLDDTGEIRAAAETFLAHAHAFDYEAMRASATADFEILIFGRRMDMDAFETLLRSMEEEREGQSLGSYELVDRAASIRVANPER